MSGKKDQLLSGSPSLAVYDPLQSKRILLSVVLPHRY